MSWRAFVCTCFRAVHAAPADVSWADGDVLQGSSTTTAVIGVGGASCYCSGKALHLACPRGEPIRHAGYVSHVVIRALIGEPAL